MDDGRAVLRALLIGPLRFTPVSVGLDGRVCSRCGGRLRFIARIDEAAVVDRILRPRGLPAEIPTPRPDRTPPLRLDSQTKPAGRCHVGVARFLKLA